MTRYNSTGEHIIPREITFSNITLPAKRAVSIIFENGTTRATTFYFTYLDYSDEKLVEVYWWIGDTKKIGYYGLIEALFPFEVKNPDTGLTEFVVLPRSTDTMETVDNRLKAVKMSPRLWVYEVDDLA